MLFASKYFHAIVALSQNKHISNGNYKKVMLEIARTTAEILEVERVNAWLFDKTKTHIHCLVDYNNLDRGFHKPEIVLDTSAFPAYFEQMEKVRMVVVNDSASDPFVSGIYQSYILPLNIGALMDAPIMNKDKFIGVICCEQIGHTRVWTNEEKIFMLAIANLLSLCLSNYKIRRAAKIVHQKNIGLQKLNSELDAFLYSISHQLRAPIASVLGLLNLCEMETDAKKVVLYHEKMTFLVNRLDETIQDILNLTYNVRLPIVMEKTDIKAIVDGIILEQKTNNQLPEIQLTTHYNSDTWIETEPMRLKVILHNLISNAIKYRSAEHPWVNVTFFQTEEAHVFCVKDNGQGIPLQYQKDIFKMFFRATKQSNGSGLGLYLVKEMVNSLKGNIELVSQEGTGSTFTLTFPKMSEEPKVK